MTGAPLVDCREVALEYHHPLALSVLRDVTLSIDAGESVAICGPSGAGKSTLLNILGLLQAPTAGGYVFDGHDTLALTEGERATLRARRIGFVFQSFHLLPGRPALENIALGMLYTHAAADRLERARAAADIVGITHRLSHRPNEMSGGERQRVAIARAIAADPPLVLADEPTGNLDSHTSQAILDLFDDVNKRGVTIVVVTHSPAVAERCRRRVEIHDGTILSDTNSPFV